MSKTVINKRSQIIWDNGFAPDGQSLPKVSTSDAGKVLTVDEEGKWTAGEGSGGAEYTAGDNIQISADNVISATDTTYTAGDNVAISADNEISSVNTIVFNAKYFRATDTFQYDDTAIAPFLAEVFKNDKRAIVRVQDGNYNIFDIYTLQHYESYNNIATFTKTQPIIVSASQREIVCSYISLSVVNGTGTLSYTNEGVTDLPEGATQGQIPVADGHGGWVAGTIPTELPSVSSADEGKVLKVDANGDWAVGTDNNTTYTAGTNVSINAQNEISATDTTYSDATTTDAGLMSAADKVKLNGIETGAEANVNADWNAASGDAQILNKPNLAAVATSGDYTDLTNKPTIPSYSAGTNVQINNGVISATDTTYTAGTNVQINGNVISATDTVYTLPTADASTLGGVKVGSNLSIDSNGVLSATDTTYSAGSGITITGTVIAADAQLPAVTSVDEGKVLKVDNNGTWAVGSDDNTTYSAGTNITIDANNQISAVDTTYSAGTGITITGTTIAADSQLPAYSATENGKVLSVDGNGDLEWATPSGGGGGETLTLIDSATVTHTTATWSGSMVFAVISDVDFGNYTKFLIEITPDKTGPTNTSHLLGDNAETGFYLEGRKIGSDYVFNPLYMGKYSNKASNPSYNVMCCLSVDKMDFADHSDLYVYARSDSLNGSVQPYLFRYSNTKVALYGVS